jgi:SAM-dependent methyltransferase
MQLAQTWDCVASGYAEASLRFRAFADEAWRVAGSPTGRLLDVAAGPGTLALMAAAGATHVTAVDFSPGMVTELRERAARAGLTNIEAHVMDAQALALADESFDVAFCMFGFMFFPDRSRVFAELHRVLRPGGRMVISTWAPIERRPVMKIAFDALAEILPDLPPPAKGDLQQPEVCVREAGAAAFRDVVAHPFTGAIHFDSAEQYVQVLTRSAPPIVAVRTHLGDAWPAVEQRMIERVRRSIPGPADLAAEAIFTTGTR